MAPLFFMQDTPINGGVSALSHAPSSWTNSGTAYAPPPVSPATARKDAMRQKMRHDAMKKSPKSLTRSASVRKRADSDWMWANGGPASSSPSPSPSPPGTGSIVTKHRRESSMQEKRDFTEKHKHGHKMLAEMIMRGDTVSNFDEEQGEQGGHQFKWSNLPHTATNDTTNGRTNETSSRKKKGYIPSIQGIEPVSTTDNRFKSSVSIRPPHAKNSSVRMGFSGHAANMGRRGNAVLEATKRGRELMNDFPQKMLIDTPVTVPEGILKDTRCGAMFRAMGEFPHRDRVPLDERVKKGRELNRKPDSLIITKAGGISWSGQNIDMPWEALETCTTDNIRSELDWLKDGAFIKGKVRMDGTTLPRTKGQISKELHAMTRKEIINFVPIHNRKEYRDNILGVRQTPKRKTESAPSGDTQSSNNEHSTLSWANQGKLTLATFNLHEVPRGDLSVIESEQRSEAGLEDDVTLVRSTLEGNGGQSIGMTGSDGADGQMAFLQQSQQGSMASYTTTVSEVVPAGSAVGLMGRSMSTGEIRFNKAPYMKGDQPVKITEGLKASILRKKGIIS